ncbi:MAG: hypothetical protein HOW73_49185 [Polyangiaceae bacterium]|nr:hypothetical protein [Polyangiaceae bacterium]
MKNLAAVCGALLVCSCAGPRIVEGPANREPPPTSVAVLDFSARDRAASGLAADGCLTAAMDLRLRAVERFKLEPLLAERELSRSAEQPAEYYKQLGELAGADAFVLGSSKLTNHGPAERLEIRARLVSARSGEVIRVVTYTAVPTGMFSESEGDAAESACRALLSD